MYAPFFPTHKSESWWVILSSKDEPTRIENPSAIKKIISLEREVVMNDIKIMAPEQAGVYHYELHVKSSDYVGELHI